MARHIPIGVRGEAAETVELKHTLAASRGYVDADEKNNV